MEALRDEWFVAAQTQDEIQEGRGGGQPSRRETSVAQDLRSSGRVRSSRSGIHRQAAVAISFTVTMEMIPPARTTGGGRGKPLPYGTLGTTRAPEAGGREARPYGTGGDALP